MYFNREITASTPDHRRQTGRCFPGLLLLFLGIFLPLLLSACASPNALANGSQGSSSPSADPTHPGLRTSQPQPTKSGAGSDPEVQAASGLTPSNTRPGTTPTPKASLPDLKPSPDRTATGKPTGTPLPGDGIHYDPGSRITVPILLYHHISDDGEDRYIIPIAAFRKQMKYLSENGYQTILISDLAAVIRDGGTLPAKPVVLTFDDGYLDTYENAFPIVKETGFHGVAYVITSTIGTKISYGYMQEDELKALHDAGWEIGSHSISHTDVKTSKLGMRNEIEKSRTDLEELLGFPIRSFSYPFGLANEWIEGQMEKYGYDTAVGLGTLITHSPKSLYYLSRREVERDFSLKDFAGLLTEDAP